MLGRSGLLPKDSVRAIIGGLDGLLDELVAAGEVGASADWHYAIMGAIPNPLMLEEIGTELGELLANDGVDAAVLLPV